MKKNFLALAVALMFISFCRKPAELVIEHAVVRMPPAGMNITGAFFTLKNGTEKEVALVGADCDIADITEVHESYNEEGIARMRRIDRLPAPAGSELVLQPGGFHIMLIDLKRELLENEEIPLVLKFENREPVTVQAKVQKMGGMAHH